MTTLYRQMVCLMAFVLIMLNPSAAHGLEFKIDGLRYSTIDDSSNTVRVSSAQSSYDSDVEVPSMVTYISKTYTVTEVGDFHGTVINGRLMLPNTIKVISSTGFSLGYFSDIFLPSSIEEIKDGAFMAPEIFSVHIEDLASWCKIKTNELYFNTPFFYTHDVYFNDIKAENLVIPSNVKEIKRGVFANLWQIKSLTIPSTVTEIGYKVFAYCDFLEKVSIASPTIGDGMFCACKSLTDVTIKNTVKTIGYCAFENTALKSVSIPSSVTSIGSHAFAGTNLTDVSIPSSVTELSSTAFDDTPWYNNQPNGIVMLNNWVYDFKGKESLPENISVSLTIPTGAVGIASGCFSKTTALSNIKIPNTVEYIGSSAFAYCTQLDNVTIPNSVSTIEYATFANCSNLKYIVIPESIKTIGAVAFQRCSSLLEITSYVKNPNNVQITGNTFDEVPTTCVLKVPKGSKVLYQKAEYWKRFSNIVEFDTNIATGDANGNGVVDVDDMNTVINIITHKASASRYPGADVNNDGTIDIDDVNKIVNIVLHKE